MTGPPCDPHSNASVAGPLAGPHDDPSAPVRQALLVLPWLQPLEAAALAHLAGSAASREMTCRALARLKDKGLVRTDARRRNVLPRQGHLPAPGPLQDQDLVRSRVDARQRACLSSVVRVRTPAPATS